MKLYSKQGMVKTIITDWLRSTDGTSVLPNLLRKYYPGIYSATYNYEGKGKHEIFLYIRDNEIDAHWCQKIIINQTDENGMLYETLF